MPRDAESSERIADKVLAEARGDSPRAKRPSKMQMLGFNVFDIGKFLISMAGAAAVAFFGMRFAIEKNTASIEANSARAKALDVTIGTHRDIEHKNLDERIQGIRDTTIRIEAVQQQTLSTLQEVKEDIRDLRVGGRRAR